MAAIVVSFSSRRRGGLVEEGWSCLGFETNKLWKKLVGRGWFRDDLVVRGGANVGKYLRVYWICIEYFWRSGISFYSLRMRYFFFCRFIGDLDWDSRYSPFYSFFLSIDREVFGNLFYFGNYLGISCVEMEFERLYHWFFFFFCFFVYIGLGWYFIGSLLRVLEFLLIFFFILARSLFVNYLSKILLK